jgi:alpha-L-fucosidase
VEKFSIYAETGNGEKEIYKGTVIGFNKIALFKPIETSKLRLEINSCRFEPYINSFQIIRKN